VKLSLGSDAKCTCWPSLYACGRYEINGKEECYQDRNSVGSVIAVKSVRLQLTRFAPRRRNGH
jgi:hypothetical protein